MKPCSFLTRVLIAGACLMVFPAIAQVQATHQIVVENAWALPLPAVAVNGASYLTIRNHGQDDERSDHLIGVRSPVAEQVEIHNMIHSEGQMKMQKTDRVEIPAQGKVEFKPGATHIMLINLTKPLVEGEMFPLTLEFEKAGAVDVMVMISSDQNVHKHTH